MKVWEYRIYEVAGQSEYGGYRNFIDRGFVIAENRENFKNTIKEMYPEIKFGRSKKMEDGTVYCIMIYSEDVEKSDRHLIYEYKCDYCHKKVKKEKAELYRLYQYSHWGIGNDKPFNYCSAQCRENHYHELKGEYIKANDGINPFEWIDKESCCLNNAKGFIYKISKKSTNEFYVGQTNSIPVFRWGQHLKSDRFPMSHIDDYIFEVLEIVNKNNKRTLLEIESEYIQKEYNKNPKLCLNIAGIKRSNL